MEIEEGAFSVALEVLTLEIVHPIHPLTVEWDLGLGVNMAGVDHLAGHGALQLVDYEIWLKFLLRLRLADGH